MAWHEQWKDLGSKVMDVDKRPSRRQRGVVVAGLTAVLYMFFFELL